MANLIQCPHCGGNLDGMADGRATWWRIRVRLYDAHQPAGEPMADSDSDLEADQPGRTVVRGVAMVLLSAAEAAHQWHGGQTLRGMGHDVLATKERGIRSTLWRKKGRATIRIEYDTLDSFSDHKDHSPRYLARVDFEKTAQPEGTVETET